MVEEGEPPWFDLCVKLICQCPVPKYTHYNLRSTICRQQSWKRVRKDGHSPSHTALMHSTMKHIHQDRDILLSSLLYCCGFIKDAPRFLGWSNRGWKRGLIWNVFMKVIIRIWSITTISTTTVVFTVVVAVADIVLVRGEWETTNVQLKVKVDGWGQQCVTTWKWTRTQTQTRTTLPWCWWCWWFWWCWWWRRQRFCWKITGKHHMTHIVNCSMPRSSRMTVPFKGRNSGSIALPLRGLLSTGQGGDITLMQTKLLDSLTSTMSFLPYTLSSRIST